MHFKCMSKQELYFISKWNNENWKFSSNFYFQFWCVECLVNGTTEKKFLQLIFAISHDEANIWKLKASKKFTLVIRTAFE